MDTVDLVEFAILLFALAALLAWSPIARAVAIDSLRRPRTPTVVGRDGTIRTEDDSWRTPGTSAGV